MYLITNSANLIVEICEHPCYVRRQANGVVVLSEQDKADAIYSNDSNTFWPTQQVGYLCDRHTLVEVESVPAEVVAGFYFYHAGEFYTTEANLTALAKARAPGACESCFRENGRDRTARRRDSHRTRRAVFGMGIPGSLCSQGNLLLQRKTVPLRTSAQLASRLDAAGYCKSLEGNRRPYGRVPRMVSAPRRA